MPELRVAMSRRQQSGSTKQTRAAAPLLIWSTVNVPANPRPAATVVVLRDSSAGPEVFMVRRHEGTAFMGGAHVFPGGRVDPRDEADVAWCDGIVHACSQLADMPAADAIAYHVAAARELFEEAGVMLARDRAGAFVSLAGPDVHERFKQARTAVHSGTTTSSRIVVVPLTSCYSPTG